MKRKLTVAFALLATYLAVSAAPVAAANTGTAVISSNSSGSDFNNATRTDNMLVDESSGHIEYNGYAGATSRWPFNGSSTDVIQSNDATLNGPSYATGKNGQGLNFEEDNKDRANITNVEDLPTGDDSFSVTSWVKLESTPEDGITGGDMIMYWGDTNNDQSSGLKIRSDKIQHYFWGNDLAGDYNFSVGTWYHVGVTYDGQTRTLYVNGQQVAQDNAGSVNMADSKVSVGYEFRRDATFMDGTIDDLRLYHEAITQSEMQELASNAPAKTASAGHYVGANHSADNAVEGYADLSLSDTSATVEWQAWDGTSWVAVNSSTYTTSGNKTLDISGTGYSKWRVNVSFDKTGADPLGTVKSEGVKVETHAPTAKDGTASPSGNETLTTNQPTLSIDVEDTDFATAQGDSVTVEFYLDGSKIDTKTVTSNGTVSTQANNLDGGQHSWHVELSDSYGLNSQSDTFNFKTPSELRIYNESDPDTLVSGPNTTVTLKFYFDDGGGMTVERETSDGTIDMTGLPVDESFVVVADASDYYPRRIYVQSLLQTQRVYLLPDSATAVEPIFTLQDYTGTYSGDTTVLQVQRSLNGSWQTVSGDFFGASGEYPVQLERNIRHRLVLIDTTTGERKILGTYTPLTSETQTLKVKSSGEIELISPAVVDISPATGSLPALDGTTISAILNGRGQTVDSWSAEVTYHEDGNVTTLATASKSSEGTADLSVDLSDKVNGTVKVDVTYTVDGTTATETFTYQVSKTYQNKYSLFNTVGRIDTLVPANNRESFKAFVSLIVTVVLTTGAVSQLRASTEMAGLTAVGCIAGFAIIGWMSYDVLFASVVAFGAFTAVRRGL